MEETSILGLLLVGLNVAASYQGFKDPAFFDRYKFEVDGILVQREFDRLLSSGFLHANWIHLIFNMIALYSFSPTIEQTIGFVGYLVIYFGSLLGGNLLALFFHRMHGDYSAIGASGAVSGIVFSAIILAPFSKIELLFIPFGFTAWIFGLLFVLLSIYGIKSQLGNIGHEAHLGGAITGLLITLFYWPDYLELNPLILLVLLVPTSIFLLLIAKYPQFLLMDNYFQSQKDTFKKQRSNKKKAKQQKVESTVEQELDKLLAKIQKNGMESLTQQELDRLNAISKHKNK